MSKEGDQSPLINITPAGGKSKTSKVSYIIDLQPLGPKGKLYWALYQHNQKLSMYVTSLSTRQETIEFKKPNPISLGMRTTAEHILFVQYDVL